MTFMPTTPVVQQQKIRDHVYRSPFIYIWVRVEWLKNVYLTNTESRRYSYVISRNRFHGNFHVFKAIICRVRTSYGIFWLIIFLRYCTQPNTTQCSWLLQRKKKTVWRGDYLNEAISDIIGLHGSLSSLTNLLILSGKNLTCIDLIFLLAYKSALRYEICQNLH